MRRIITSQLQAAGGGVPLDGFFDRILKFIPADIVAGWVALTGLATSLSTGVRWALLGIIAVITFLWTKKHTDVPGQPTALTQCIVATVSFLVWAFALRSGPFATMTYAESLGSIVLIVYTLGIGLITPKTP